MLRTLLALMGIPPQKSVPRHPGITDVKNMNDDLGDPRVQAVLTENVWMYLTVLYRQTGNKSQERSGLRTRLGLGIQSICSRQSVPQSLSLESPTKERARLATARRR